MVWICGYGSRSLPKCQGSGTVGLDNDFTTVKNMAVLFHNLKSHLTHSGMNNIGESVLVKGLVGKWLLFVHFPKYCNYFYTTEKIISNGFRFTCVSLFHYKISLLFFRFFSLIFASNFSLRFPSVIFA